MGIFTDGSASLFWISVNCKSKEPKLKFEQLSFDHHTQTPLAPGDILLLQASSIHVDFLYDKLIAADLEVCGPDDPHSKPSRLPFIIRSGQDG